MNGFNLWVGLGASLGLWRVWRGAPDRQSGTWLNIALLACLAALVGARLFYVLENWGYYSRNLIEIVQLWQGGLAWAGAVVGGGLVLIGVTLVYRPPRSMRPVRTPLGLVSDRLYPLLPPVAIAIWLGCWQAGAAFGAQLPPETWWGMSMADESGVVSKHIPLQPLAALTLVAFFWFLETRKKLQRTPGRISGIAISGLLLHTLATTLVNGSPSPVWNGLRTDTWYAIVFLAFFLILVLVNSLVLRIWRRQSVSSL